LRSNCLPLVTCFAVKMTTVANGHILKGMVPKAALAIGHDIWRRKVGGVHVGGCRGIYLSALMENFDEPFDHFGLIPIANCRLTWLDVA